MDNSVRMQVLQSGNDLICIALDFELIQTFTPLQQFVETLVLTKLEKDVDAFAVFEEMCELSNVRVLDRTMNLDLAH